MIRRIKFDKNLPNGDCKTKRACYNGSTQKRDVRFWGNAGAGPLAVSEDEEEKTCVLN